MSTGDEKVIYITLLVTSLILECSPREYDIAKVG